MKGKFVAYYRVSTAKQGTSGLGLEAQRAAVMTYLNGGRWALLKEFTEVETGKGANALDRRPVLREAISYAKKHKAKLIIAKLDRLARNVNFVSSLMEAKVPFVCADMPEANELTINILASVAQYERELISQRTKAALKAVKERGVKLGNPNLKADNTKRAAAAQAFAESLRATLSGLQSQGLSQRRMVDQLNGMGVKTARGDVWSLIQLQRVLQRLSA